MGLAGPPVVNPVSAAEAEFRALADFTPGEFDKIVQLRNAVAAAGRAAGAMAATGGGTAEVVAAEDAGELAASFIGWGIVAGLLLFILALRLTEYIFVQFAGFIPFFGNRAANMVRLFFRWLDNLENDVIHYLIDQLKHLVHEFGRLVLLTLELNGIDLSRSYRSTVTTTGSTVTQGEIVHLQNEIDYLMRHLGSVQYITTNKQVTVGVPQNLWDQLHHVEGQLWQEHQDMTDFNSRLGKVEHQVQSLQREFENLSQNVHAVRAIAVGWQDVERELESLGTTVSHFIDTSSAELNSHQRSLTQLAPLGLLLQPGVRGLKVLRQLEDTPCMCPKLPNIPRLQPELLAMYEYLTYG